MSRSDVHRRFGCLVIEAVEHPERVDRNALLQAASAVLDIAPACESGGRGLARTMAHRAINWVVMDGPDDHTKLTTAAHAFGMYSVMSNY